MFSGSQQKACAYQRCNGWRLVRQNAAPGGAQAWWGAQGLAGGQQSQFSVVAAATGGGGAGSQRCDLTQRKIPAVYEQRAASNVQREGCSSGLEQHRGTQTARGAARDARKVSMGSFHLSELQYRIAGVYGHGRRCGSQVAVQHVVGGSRRQHVVVHGSDGGRTDAGARGVGKQDLQWMLMQWQQGQHAKREIVERGGQAWVRWQQVLEELRAQREESSWTWRGRSTTRGPCS